MTSVTKNIRGKNITIDFIVEQTASGPKIRYHIDGRWYNAEKLLPEQHAVKFFSPHTLYGIKVAGLSLPADQFAQLAAELEAARATKQAQANQHRADLETGRVAVTITWQPGEHLSGFTVNDPDAAQRLIALGVAHTIPDWGVLVDDTVFDALGETFTLPALRDWLAGNPRHQMDTLPAHTEDAVSSDLVALARETAAPVLVRRTIDTCSGDAVECSVDLCETWVDPEGHTYTRRVHTF